MKNINLISSALVMCAVFALNAFASELTPIEKSGFLTTSGCAAQGAFRDCYLENYSCGSDGCFETAVAGEAAKDVQVVLFSHNDGITYKLDLKAVNLSNVDKSINRNEVTVIGNYNADTNTISATEIKPPPPPTKSFFKGCL
ncbi:hypothetical protein KKG77_01550 [bacterium]|nr:hypothetical protein [bacterium]